MRYFAMYLCTTLWYILARAVNGVNLHVVADGGKSASGGFQISENAADFKQAEGPRYTCYYDANRLHA
jgi:hypothetical protein